MPTLLCGSCGVRDPNDTRCEWWCLGSGVKKPKPKPKHKKDTIQQKIRGI